MSASHPSKSRRRPLLVRAVALASLLLHASLAWAAPPSFAQRHADLKPADAANETTSESKQRKQRWVQHFEQGNAALNAGDFKACEDHFARAWMLHQTAGTAANLGRCENHLGYHVDAAEHLSRALELFDPAGKSEDAVEQFRKETTDELSNATRSIGTLDIQNVPAGATISVGPKLRFAAPLARVIFLYPGDYAVEVKLDEAVIYSATLHIVAGRAYTREVSGRRANQSENRESEGEKEGEREKENGSEASGRERGGPTPRGPLVIAGASGAVAFLGLGVGLVAASQVRLADGGKLRSELGASFGAQRGACHAPVGERVELCKKLDAASDDAALLEHVGIAALVASGALALGTGAVALWPRPVVQPGPEVVVEPKTGPGKTGPGKVGPSDGARLSGVRAWAGPSGAQVTLEGVW